MIQEGLVSLKLSVTTGEGSVAAVSVTVASEATVGDVAEHLFRADPTREGTAPPSDATLVVTPLSQGADARTRVAPRDAAMAAAGIRAGDHVEVVAAHAVDALEHSPAVATVTVIAGPDAGRTVSLGAGSHVIGRDAEAAVSLTDSLTSPRHARLVVGETFEIVDMGSTNGVLIDGAFVTRATLAQGDRITVGATDLTIGRSAPIERAAPSAPTVPFTRSPRVVSPLPTEEIVLPSPPEQPTPRPFPRTALLAPVILGLTMYLMTGRMLSLVFVAMSPLMMVGGLLDNRHHQRKEARSRAYDFEKAIELSERRLEEAQRCERAIRLARSPSVADVCDAVRSAAPPLWTHRAEHGGFLEVRLGLGVVPSSLVLKAPALSNAVEGTWESVARLHDHYSSIGGVPVVASLSIAGGLGIAGAAPASRAMARAAVVQLAGLHSPMECVIAAFVSPEGVREWAWIEWLPHVSSAASPLAGDHVVTTRREAQRLLVGLEEVVAHRAGKDIGAIVPALRGLDTHPSVAAGHEQAPTLPAIVVVVEEGALAEKGRLIRLAEKGADVNVHVLWIASAVSGLPAACRSFVAAPDIAGGGAGIAGHVRRGGFDDPVTCEVLSVTDATDLARRLACIEDVGVVIDDAADVPTAVSYLEAHGFESLDPRHHKARWREEDEHSGGRRPFSLRALVGHAGDEPCYLDLKTQGPHALVGGTTGAGKSEFLQAWVLGMASAYSPQKVTFLFVDYKGGSAFADCVGLPHCVGLVTDLTPHLVTRALASLRAELRFRERLFAAKSAKDLETLAGRGDPETPPSLVIVIDEFAALAREAPDFVDGVVDIGQRGRSLGLHLIMATQRPAGVIKESLRANTNLRIALRMADEADSSDILGSSVAARVDPAIPGRAIARTGPGRLVTFQSAFAGAHSTPGAGRARISVRGFALASGTAWKVAGQDSVAVAGRASDESDASRVVSALAEAAMGSGFPPPRRPWLNQLADLYDVATLPREAAGGAAFGLIDDPSQQAQFAAVYEPDRDGNLMVLGGAGAGKSTALRTLALATMLDPRGGPVHVYCIDAAGGGLDMLRPLPAVADVVDSDDFERVGRMLTRLVGLVRERARAFTAARASSLPDYRERAGGGAIPRITLLVDGYGSFQNDYMNELGRQQVFADFRDVLTQGRSVGVNVVLAADRLGALHTSVQALMSRTLVLRLNDEAHYGMLGLRATGLTAQSPPGRGIDLASRKEIQVAVAGGSSRIDEQARAVEALAASAPRGGLWEAEAIPRMPRVVRSRDVPGQMGGLPVLGIDGATLTPCGFDLDRPIVIAGQAGTGRTSALAWVAYAIRRRHPDRTLVHLTQRRTSIGALPVWTASFAGPSAGDDLLASWGAALDAAGDEDSQVVLCIENVQDFGASLSDGAFVQAIKRARRNGHLLIGEADTQSWVSGPLVAEIKSARRGLLLAPEAGDAQVLFGVASARMSRADAPPGRGIWIEAGKVATVQIPWVDGELSPEIEGDSHARTVAS